MRPQDPSADTYCKRCGRRLASSNSQQLGTCGVCARSQEPPPPKPYCMRCGRRCVAEDSRRIGLCGLCSTLTRGRSPSTLREAVDRESRVAEEAQRERSTQLRLRRDVFD